MRLLNCYGSPLGIDELHQLWFSLDIATTFRISPYLLAMLLILYSSTFSITGDDQRAVLHWLRSHLNNYRSMVSKGNPPKNVSLPRTHRFRSLGSQLSVLTALCPNNIHQQLTALGSMEPAKVFRSLV